MNLTDIFRVLHLSVAQYTFFSGPHGISSKIDHILGNKANLNEYKKIDIIPWTTREKTKTQQQKKLQKILKCGDCTT
jgi:hypothetical protein